MGKRIQTKKILENVCYRLINFLRWVNDIIFIQTIGKLKIPN